MTDLTMETPGAAAERALRRALARRLLREVVIKQSRAFERLHRRLQLAMSRAFDRQLRAAIAQALDRLRDLGPGPFTPEDGRLILSAMAQRLGADAMQAALRGPLLSLTDALYRVGRREVSLSVNIDFRHLPMRDLRALDILQSGNLYWVGKTWDSMTRDLLQGALTDYFDGGMTREQLTRRFAIDFAGLSERGQRYFELLADHTATRTRELGRVGAYREAGVRWVRVRAWLDDRTTDICRALHGRVLPVQRLERQRDRFLRAVKARNETAARASWRMHRNDRGILGQSTDNLPAHTAMPPYHFRCRTITVAYQRQAESETDSWRRRTMDRQPLSRSDTDTLIARLKQAPWPHGKVLRQKYQKHGKDLSLNSLADFTNSAEDLIRRGDRDVYLAVRKGQLDAVFARKAKNSKGRDGYLVTVVDVANRKIRSHHHKRTLSSSQDEVQNVKQPGRGIMKWLMK